MFGYWVSIPSYHSTYRLFLTNGSSGLLGVREIYTDLWSVVSWQVTNHDISIDLASITHPEWHHEYIRGHVELGEINAVHGGINQDGESYKSEMVFYREEMLKEDLAAASAVMTNYHQIIGTESAAIRSPPFRSETNQTPSAAGSRR